MNMAAPLGVNMAGAPLHTCAHLCDKNMKKMVLLEKHTMHIILFSSQLVLLHICRLTCNIVGFFLYPQKWKLIHNFKEFPNLLQTNAGQKKCIGVPNFYVYVPTHIHFLSPPDV